MKSYKLVRVKWVDSAFTHGWQYLSDVKQAPTECETVGYLVMKNKTCVTIAQNINLENDGHCGEFMTIPKCCILSINRLRKK